ncbi:MAG: GntR family transcriptional regulator [Desulfobulbaceae bacterium]|nr:MAG: GntR family transcriptional regulator [Desulfobulbaceae bacterium]
MRYISKQLPLYVQIAEGLADRIEVGELKPGQRLTSERELSDALGVTRVTLRQALHLLEAEGLITRKQGSGNYVAEPKIERKTTQLNPFTQGMERSGFKTGAEVTLQEKRSAKISVANRLKIPVSSDLHYYHRIRTLNNAPVMLEKFYFPVSYFPGLEEIDFHNRSAYEILKTEFNIVITSAEQSLEAVAASEYEADLLRISVGAPLLLERRIGFDQHNRPVEYAKDLYRGDKIKFLLDTHIEKDIQP